MKRFTSEPLVLSIHPDAGEGVEAALEKCPCTACTDVHPNDTHGNETVCACTACTDVSPNDTRGNPTKPKGQQEERDLHALQRQLEGILCG